MIEDPLDKIAFVLVAVVVEDGGPLRVGSRIKERLRFPRLEGVDLMVEYDPPRRYAERTLGTVDYLTTLSFSPVPGGTRVTYRADTLLSIPTALLGGLAKRWSRRGMVKSRQERFRKLRRELETRTVV